MINNGLRVSFVAYCAQFTRLALIILSRNNPGETRTLTHLTLNTMSNAKNTQFHTSSQSINNAFPDVRVSSKTCQEYFLYIFNLPFSVYFYFIFQLYIFVSQC